MHAAKSYCTYPGNCRLSIAGSPSYWASTSQWSPQHPCPLLCPGMRMCSLCTPTKQAHSAGPATNYGELAAGTARAAALQRCSAARPPRCATARRAARCRRARRLASAPARLLTLDLTSIFSYARRRQAVSLVRSWLGTTLLSDALAVAAQALVARGLAARRPAAARAVVARTAQLAGALGLALLAALGAAAGALPRAFSSDPAVLAAVRGAAGRAGPVCGGSRKAGRLLHALKRSYMTAPRSVHFERHSSPRRCCHR